MRKVIHFLARRVLPGWVREELLAEIQTLRQENQRQKERIDRLSAYIDGLEAGIRAQRKINIYAGEAAK